MDLLAICRTLWRHKIAVLPVLLLTLLGAGYAFIAVKPVYEARASFVLMNAPPSPTPEQMAADPSLANVNANNPYARFGESAIVINIVSRRVSADSMREQLIAAGADERYDIMPSNRYGFASPIVDIIGVGDTAESAIHSANLVGGAFTKELGALQAAEGTDPAYMIQTRPVEVADRAVARVSGRLRVLIAVLALGAMAAFGLVTVLQALDQRRAEAAVPRAARPRTPQTGHLPELHPERRRVARKAGAR